MRLREKKKNRFIAPLGVILGMAAGIAGGLLFAPSSGRRTRKMLRDKLTKYSTELRDLRDATTGRAKHLSFRIRGRYHEMRDSMGLTDEPAPTDSQMVQRVRADLGHDPNVPLHQLDIDATDGIIYLRGQIDSRETSDYVASRVAGVMGVKGVVNELYPAG